MTSGALLLALLLVGCAGARPRITFDEAKYPVSLTAWVPDHHGRPTTGTKVGEFKASGSGWGLFWTGLQLDGVDFSDELNEQVAAANGGAVVNLEVRIGQLFTNVFPGFFVLSLVPVYPGGALVEVTGDIVR
jgi:hypothetical protein